MNVYDISELEDLKGQVLGRSSWIKIDQELINEFARVTGDDQWIHTDVEKAKKSEFGSTIAHGMLTLSTVSRMVGEVMTIKSSVMGINYGFNKVRFINPVLVGSQIMGTISLKDIEEAKNGTKLYLEVEVKESKHSQLVCYAEFLALIICS